MPNINTPTQPHGDLPMTTIRMITVSVEYDEDDNHDVAAVDRLAGDIENLIGMAGLALDDLNEETL